MADIIPVTFTNYNDTNVTRLLTMEAFVGESILPKASDYQVCVRDLEVPINNKSMPINSTRQSFQVIIFNEYKTVDLVIPELDYGINVFEIPGPIMSVASFIKSLNDIVFKKASPVELGYFFLREEDNAILYRYNAQHANEHDMIKIYFDNKLQTLFDFDYDFVDTAMGLPRLKIVKDFTPTPSTEVREVASNSFTFPRFYNIKGVRVYSNLPTPGHRIYAQSSFPYSNIAPLLTTISYNSMQMYQNTNLIYIPTTLLYNSLTSDNPLARFSLRFAYLYADGTEEPIVLAPLDYAKMTITFERIASD